VGAVGVLTGAVLEALTFAFAGAVAWMVVWVYVIWDAGCTFLSSCSCFHIVPQEIGVKG
jgi:hypothetical protein